jgi:uncharacterized delta-60 repeat protein
MWLFSSRKAQHTAPARRSAYRLRLERLEDRCVPSAGALDPTFGSGGIVTTSSGHHAIGALLQPNGDIIAYRQTYQGVGLTLARYTPSGSLDTTFGSKGIVSNSTMRYVNQAVLQADGKIVVVGRYQLARYNSNGSLDTTFGSNGLVTFPSGFGMFSLLIQPSNGDIVVGGWFNATATDFALLRYTGNGTLDSTFGSGGEVVTPGLGGNIYYLALENGDIVAGGTGALARYTLSGSLDTTFGSGGIVMTTVTVSSLLVQPNGQIVAVGEASNAAGWALARYNVDGSLDSTFGSGGIVISSPTGHDVVAGPAGSALQSNGQIVVAGWSTVTSTLFEFGVYNSNGSPDTSFGSGGFVTTSWYGLWPFPIGRAGGGVVIQPDGKIVVAASAAGFHIRLGRFGPSAPQIGAFTASPNPVTAGSNVSLTASNITLADPGSSITQVAFYVQIGGTNTLLGYGTQSSPGVWTFTFTVNLTPGSYTLIAQATDSDGVLGDPLALNLQVI